jgi:SAM-dependent methyltransferase
MNWHSRFVQQAAWTRDLRSYLFEHAGMERAQRVLEVGCGTGAILSELAIQATVHGLDLDPGRLVEAGVHAPGAALVCGDALRLPYPPGIFDVTFCHFLLLWVHDPLQALCEMVRVTRPGGYVLALAEPDYEARVDKPDVLAPLGRWQTESLRRQGADPGLGARLADLFRQAGMPPIETGTLRGSPGLSTGRGSPGLSTGRGSPGSGTGRRGGGRPPASGERDLEWAVLEADLAGIVPVQEIQRMKLLDEQAWERGERVLSVPTYFAWGQVKADGIIPRGGSLV